MRICESLRKSSAETPHYFCLFHKKKLFLLKIERSIRPLIKNNVQLKETAFPAVEVGRTDNFLFFK